MSDNGKRNSNSYTLARVINDGEQEMVDVTTLSTHPANPRRGDLGAVKASIAKFGFWGAIVAQRSTRHVLAGNHRLMAARELGLGDVPVVWVDVSDERARAILAADNRTSDLGGYDDAALAELLSHLSQDDLLDGTGYTLDDLDDLIGSMAGEPVEDVPEDAGEVDLSDALVSKWNVTPGRSWRLGQHIIVCGDGVEVSRSDLAASCETLIYDPEWDDPLPIDARRHTLAFCDGARAGDVVSRFGAPTWLFAWDCVSSWYTPNRPLRRAKHCLWYGPIEDYEFDGAHYGEAGEAREVTNTRGTYEHVPDPRGKHLSDVFSAPITRLHSEDGAHAHSKPVDWMRLLIGCCTRGDVLDPCGGGGTALIACEQLGRRCVTADINPAHVAAIIERWHRMTGEMPEQMRDS